ncbi:MAG TPA: hypothetical protein VMW21_02440 [Patescibacteria group bacterium]|nr:hypothetical protein [Patescibacteria group bacterium]
MSLRKKTFIFIVAFLLVPPSASALQLQNPLGYEEFSDLILAIANFIFTIALALAPLLIVVGGIYIIAAQGDPAKIQNGKNIILYTLIGLLVIFLSRGLISLLRTAIGF